MKNKCVLGIDTSNYKTSVAIVDSCGNVLCDLRKFLEVKQGERGLRQSDALFQHIKNLPVLVKEAFNGRTYDIGAVAYSSKPRPLEGSYMPVFLAGESHAKAIASALAVPAMGFSHQEGHIEALKFFSKFKNNKTLLACHFSGGTTELLTVVDNDNPYKPGYEMKITGGSKDISFGQVIDRAGVLLGMKFPAGKEMDRIAVNTDNSHTADRLLTPVKVKDGWINLSGIDTQVKRILSENILSDGKDSDFFKERIIKELFEKISAAITEMITQSCKKNGINDVILAGGVSSSVFIKNMTEEPLKKRGIDIVFDSRDLAQDNAVGTALLGGRTIWR